ncbi:28S ribosomal protein S10, mitochondrial [Bombyx mandarina]|uniref:Small ribosomal subunit protein uS10m n=2 Tax=Bombyx TaxID=7090 RepID=Q1HQ85_BOMMO|nr:mitochondrial ribosomal protein S10 [Bombyx mori]XP_028036059.1 28S ribosomal protein S10, mitochondrial [Bombyx mandarina]ABF51256.1 mitochondrial ribosomal protein S10 [Bombyx mori]
MNAIRSIWRLTPVRGVTIPNYAIRSLSANTTALPHAVEPVVPPVELDKLYKRVELEMRGIDPAVLLSYSWFCVAAASHLGIEVTKSWALRKAEKERHTLLKCVHIYKKHKVQYEIRTYFRFIHMQRLTGSTCDTYLEYIERNLPEGCALKVTKIECQKLPEHLVPPKKESEE